MQYLEEVTSDAYFKIVSSSAGTLEGASSNYKIPISSMPSHNHGGSVSTETTTLNFQFLSVIAVIENTLH